MQQTTVFHSPPPFESEMKAEVEQGKAQVAPAAASQPEATPSVEFVPYIDEAEEKRKFWKTVIITMGIFLVISVVVIGFIISQRLSQPPTKLDIQYLDGGPSASVTTAIVITRKPTRTPMPGIIGPGISPIQVGITRIPTNPQRQVTLPFIIINNSANTPTPGTVANTPTPTAGGATSTPGPTNTPVPTLLPTTTTTPTPTAMLQSSTSSIDFGTSSTSVTRTFTIINTGGAPLSITTMNFSSGGDIPFSFTDAGLGCILFAATPTPIVISPQTTRCVGITFSTTTAGTYTNGVQIWWNTSNHVDVTLVGIRATPTPTNTITPTP